MAPGADRHPPHDPRQPGDRPPSAPVDDAVDRLDDATDHAAQRAAEQALQRWLAEDGTDDTAWEELACYLVIYAHPRLLAWIRSTRISEICMRGGATLAELLRNTIPWSRRLWQVDDIDDLAADTLVLALQRFKLHAAAEWDPRRGASLRTYFMGQCAWSFVNVYRNWLRDVAPLVTCTDEELALLAGGSLDADPHERIALREELAEALAFADDRLRVMLARRDAGYSLDEIGAELGMTAKAVESALYRFRRLVQEHWQQRTADRPAPEGDLDGYQAG